MPPRKPHPRSHLYAFASALLCTGLAWLATVLWCRALERRYIHELAPEFGAEKLQGSALQKQAFRQSDLLVLYGSSELVKEMPNNASQFFADYPTGFRVFPVGKPGTTSLAVLQKVAAVGRDIRKRKVAYSISPGWFLSEIFDPSYYEGNFSAFQALEFSFSTDLSRELKRDIARRMILFPKTLDERWLLDFTLHCLAGDTWRDRALYLLIRPFGLVAQAVGRTQDHVAAALHILDEDEKLNPGMVKPRGLQALKWAQVVKRAAKFANNTVVQSKRNEINKRRSTRGARAKGFLQAITHAREWTDIELLMRVFEELRARPLLLSMPIEDIRLEVYGLGPSARTSYVERLDAMANRFHFPHVDFREHEGDPAFTFDFQDHLSPEGWLFYNKALDDFFHDRISAL